MPYIEPEVIEQVRQIDLLTYLQNYEPDELIKFSKNTYCTRTHDSLKISNGMWCWFSRGIGGKTALDYLIKVKGYTFMEAVEIILSKISVHKPVYTVIPKQEKNKMLVLPDVSRCATHAVEYLHSRGIDYDLIDFCIHTGKLYESYPHHNVVFLGADIQGHTKYAFSRGIGTSFYGEAEGSDKRYSFNIIAENGSTILNVFESAIDLLSYATLQKMCGKNWREENLLSLAGVYKPKADIKESTPPAALMQFLSDHPNIKKIILRLDNDRVGKLAANTIKAILSSKYEVVVELSPKGKDYNDFLCMELGINITPKRKVKER